MVSLGITVLKSALIGIITIFLDFLIHFFASQPFETLEYFTFKFVIAFGVAFILIGLGFLDSLIGKVAGAFIFASVFHVIYGGLTDGTQIVFGEEFININRATMVFGITGFFEVGFVFFIVHGLAFFIGALIADLIKD